MSTTPQRPIRPADRYGEDQPAWHRVAARTAVIALAVLGLAWVVWAGLSQGMKSVNATLVTYQAVDPTRMRADLDVTMPPGHTGRCTLEAKSVRHLTVGQATVDIPASTQRTQRIVAQIRTQEEAAAVEVVECQGT